MKGKLLIFLVAVLLGFAGYAQETEIRGSVENELGQPLKDIVIKLIDGERYTLTDHQGHFSIRTSEGQEAIFSHLSYVKETVELKDGMQIVLQEKSVDIDDIIIKADLFYNPSQSEVIYEDIKAPTQPRNVSDLFRDIPGFAVQKRGAYASEPVFRAFKYEQLNIQYDGGMKILNACPNRMDPITTHVIPEEIERIEIVKGPFTVRYGQNFGGIVNLVSKTPDPGEETVSGNLESGFESNGNNFTGLGSVLLTRERFDLELNGSYRNYGDYTDGNGTEVPSSFTSTDYSIKLGVNPSQNQRFRLTWRQSFGRDIRHAGLPMDSPYDDSYLLGLDYKIKEVSQLIESITFKGFYSDVDHLMSNKDRPNFMMMGAESNVFVTTWGGKTEMTLIPGKNSRLFVGADLNTIERKGDRIRTIKMMNGNMLPEPIIKVDKIWQDSEIRDIGIFAEGKLPISERSVLTAGLRSDFIDSAINDPEQDFLALYGGEIKDQSEVNLSGNISYQYRYGRTRFQFSLGRGVRTASIVERYINHFNVNFDPFEYVGNPYLNPEINHQLEFSMDQQFDHIVLGATIFYSFLTDYITAVVDESIPRKYMPTTEPVFAKRFINVDDALQTGFEVYANVNFSEALSLLTDLSYTYGQNKVLDEPLPQIAPLTGHISLNYDRDKFWLNMKSRLVAEQNRIAGTFGETRAPGFVTFDLSGGFTPLGNLSVGAAVLNIFNTDYYEHLNFSYRNSNVLSGRIHEPGRNFTIYVQYSF